MPRLGPNRLPHLFRFIPRRVVNPFGDPLDRHPQRFGQPQEGGYRREA
jgi:hypothetical protein